MSKIIGIDLGTTNSCVAVLDKHGVPQVLASETGERTLPSVVAWIAEAGAQAAHVVVGIPAKRQQVSNATSTVFGAKRLIGRKVNAEEIGWFARLAPFRIVSAPNGDAWIRIDGQAVSPQEVASHVLRRMKSIAEAALGEIVTRAIVTVPAYFDEFQRQATRAAGAIAGLDIIRILNEPTAAALAYGVHRVGEGRKHIAVFDLGGGTFDISVMAVENGLFEVLSTGGDTALGGEDWDRRVVETLADEIFDTARVDITTSPVAIGRLREAAEAAKKELSTAKTTAISLPFLATGADGAPVNFERKLSRDELESWTDDLLQRLIAPCERALQEARLAAVNIDEVLLVGGMTRWPAIVSIIERVFGNKISRGANPDEVVALGAATFAGILADDANDTALLDVTPHDIGLKIGSNQMTVLVPRNSMLPCRVTKVFATTQDDQSFVSFELLQGNSSDPDKNRKLARVVLDHLPRGKAGTLKVELTLTVDVESIVACTAKELTTGRETGVTIRPSGGLSHEEIIEIISRRRHNID
ncbi:MAG: Hsp70 family protein [Myxococcales bacterium]|nr:Hsp70 family protein [Myxococcales bacterium]